MAKDLYQEWALKLADREAHVTGRSHYWDKYLRYYRMDVPAAKEGGIWVNYQYGLSRLLLPSIYFRNPEVVVNPRGGTPMAYCMLLRDLLNYELVEIEYEDEARKVVFDTFFCGLGVMKFGFAPVLRKRKSPTPMERAQMLFQAMFEAGAPEGDRLEKDLTDFDPNQRITNELPFGVRISPNGFFIDKGATCIEDARWVGHRVLVPVDDVKRSRKYPTSVTRGIEGTHRIQDERAYNQVEGAVVSADGTLGGSKGDPDLVAIYEIWDREHDKLLVMDSYNIGQGSPGKFLRDEPNPYPSLDGFPFAVMVFNPDPETPYGVPDAMVWHNPAEAMNMIDSMHLSHMKRFNRKYLASEGAFAEEELDKLTLGPDGTVVRCRATTPPGGALIPIEDAPLSGDLYQLREVVRNNITFLSGVTDQRRGDIQKTSTATEASIVEQQARIRDNDRSLVVSKFVTTGVRILLQLSRQFLTPEFHGVSCRATRLGLCGSSLLRRSSRRKWTLIRTWVHHPSSPRKFRSNSTWTLPTWWVR